MSHALGPEDLLDAATFLQLLLLHLKVAYKDQLSHRSLKEQRVEQAHLLCNQDVVLLILHHSTF